MQEMLILRDNHARCTLDIAFTGSVPDHPPELNHPLGSAENPVEFQATK